MQIGNKGKRRNYILLGMLTLFMLVVSGCGLTENTGNGSGSGKEAAGSAKTADVKTYQVATRGTFRPFTYMDDKDRLTGYDIEILREVEKRNPDVKFEFKLMSVDAAFLGLESGQVDVVANQIVATPKRAEKSIFTKEINNYTSRKLAVRGSETGINGIDDMRGRKAAVISNSEVTRQLQQYNETANPPIELVFTDKGSTETLNLVVTGRVDAAPTYEVTIDDARKTLGLDIKAAGPVMASDPTCYALRKTPEGQALADKIDATIAQMRADGTLQQLSQKFLGKDYTVPQM